MTDVIFEIKYRIKDNKYISTLKEILKKERLNERTIFDLDTEGGIASTFVMIMNDLTEHAYLALCEVPLFNGRVDLVLTLPSIINSLNMSQHLVYTIGNNYIKLSSRGLIIVEIKRFKRLINGYNKGRERGKIVKQIIDRILKLGAISNIYLLSACYGCRIDDAIKIMKKYIDTIKNEINVLRRKNKIIIIRVGGILIHARSVFALENEYISIYILHEEISREFDIHDHIHFDIDKRFLGHIRTLTAGTKQHVLYLKSTPSKGRNFPGYLFSSPRPHQKIQIKLYLRN